MASVTVNLTGYQETLTGLIFWSDDVSLGNTFDAVGTNQTLTSLSLYDETATPGAVRISLIDIDDRFTPEFEATGRIIVEASDSETLEVMIADADMSEPYEWTPTNSAEVIAFVSHLRGLTDQNATLTLTDDDPSVAPSIRRRYRRCSDVGNGHGHYGYYRTRG